MTMATRLSIQRSVASKALQCHVRPGLLIIFSGSELLGRTAPVTHKWRLNTTTPLLSYGHSLTHEDLHVFFREYT
jgi:hypothetical protein